jgi:hypothetical protein
MDIDENGRTYVVEDRGYPLSTDNPLGRVKLLVDTEGDGIPDRMTLFADKLIMPTGKGRHHLAEGHQADVRHQRFSHAGRYGKQITQQHMAALLEFLKTTR